MGAGDRIAELVKSLPERDLAALLDFAEFLASRRRARAPAGTPGSFVDAVEGVRIDAPADYSVGFELGHSVHRPVP